MCDIRLVSSRSSSTSGVFLSKCAAGSRKVRRCCALKILGDDLMHDGAPILVHESGSGKIDGILVAIDAPWQKTMVHIEQFEQNMPFTFTQHLVSAALEKSNVVPEGQVLADESIIGTILNGYETQNPYGKLAHRASVSMLMSYVDASISKIFSRFSRICITQRTSPVSPGVHCVIKQCGPYSRTNGMLCSLIRLDF